MRYECICVVCGKQFVHYHDHAQTCCSKKCRVEHGYKPKEKMLISICEICGKEFKHWTPGRRFCSKECRLAAGWIPRDPAKHSVFVCAWCGKEFEEWTYRNPRFCSRQCTSEFAARQPRPNARKPEIHVTLHCKVCGKPYETNVHQIRLRGSSYCSLKCNGIAKSESMRGDANPNWKGGFNPDHYGPNWDSQSRKAKKRDSHTCQACGYKSGGDRILDVHHIKPLREFNGDWKTANQLDNLVCLCRPCHQKVEAGQALLPGPHQSR